MKSTEQHWVSTVEAAEILGVSDVWVIKLISEGTLEAFRLNGRAWCVSRESVEKQSGVYNSQKTRGRGRPRRGLAS